MLCYKIERRGGLMDYVVKEMSNEKRMKYSNQSAVDWASS